MSASIWQILVLAIPLVLFAAAYFTTSRDTVLNRLGYLVRLLVLTVVGTALVLFTSSQLIASTAGAVFILLLGILIGFLNLRFQIMRLQDIGWSRFFALSSYVPILNLAFLLVLLCVPG